MKLYGYENKLFVPKKREDGSLLDEFHIETPRNKINSEELDALTEANNYKLIAIIPHTIVERADLDEMKPYGLTVVDQKIRDSKINLLSEINDLNALLEELEYMMQVEPRIYWVPSASKREKI